MVRLGGVEPNAPHTIFQRVPNVVDIVINENRRTSCNVDASVLFQFFYSRSHVSLFSGLGAGTTVRPRLVTPSNGYPCRLLWSHDGFEDVLNQLCLGRKGHHCHADLIVQKCRQKLFEFGPHVGHQFVRSAVPPPARVDVNDRLVKIHANKIYVECLKPPYRRLNSAHCPRCHDCLSIEGGVVWHMVVPMPTIPYVWYHTTIPPPPRFLVGAHRGLALLITFPLMGKPTRALF